VSGEASTIFDAAIFKADELSHFCNACSAEARQEATASACDEDGWSNLGSAKAITA
jgi:hypothetical protein